MMKLPDGRESLLQCQSAAANLAVVSNDVAAHQQVLPDAEGREQAPVLRHVHNTRFENLSWGQSLERHAVEENLAGLHRDQSADGAQQGRLSRAVRAN